MRLKVLIPILCAINFCLGQDLYIANDSFLYSKDIVVFVNDDIRLETSTSNIYLRGDAQLVQNTNTKNSDAGSLSIYQNQTTSPYEYNFWCSPVGISSDGTTKANENFNGSNIYDPIDHTDLSNVASTAYTFITSFNSTATALSNYWMYTYRDGEGYYDWVRIRNTGAVEPGYGFTLKGSPNTDNVLDFRGRPNNGTITVSCNYDGDDDQPTSGPDDAAGTLTGNPYPSALDLKLFFANSNTNRTKLNGEIYFWEQKPNNSHYLAHYEGGYGVYTPGNLNDLYDNGTYATAPFENYNSDGSIHTTTSGRTTDYSVNNQRRFAAVGQGFMIQSKGTGGNATFDNSMRLYLPQDSDPNGNGAIFGKRASSKTSSERVIAMSHNGVDYDRILNEPKIIPEIKIHTKIDNTFYKESIIAFRDATPNNNTYNQFFDGLSINKLESDAYLVSSDKPLSIKSILYEANANIPLGFKASHDNLPFSVSIYKLTNISEEIEIYVYDKLTQEYTDLKQYDFNVILDKGTINDRFEITFSKQNALSNELLKLETLSIYQNNETSTIVIHNPSFITIKSFQVYDVNGKLLLNRHLNSSNHTYEFASTNLNTGVYVAKIQTSVNGELAKKLVISNRP